MKLPGEHFSPRGDHQVDGEHLFLNDRENPDEKRYR